MEWIFFALLAPVFWGITFVMDKFLLDRIVKDSLSYSVFMELLWIIFVLVIILVKPISLGFPFTLWSILAGMLGMSGYFFYCKAMLLEEASRVVPLAHCTTIFTALIAFLFLKEVFTGAQYLGILMIVAGAISLTYKRCKVKRTSGINKRKLDILYNLPISPALIFIIVQCLFYALRNVIEKYSLFSIDYWTLLVGVSIGELLMTFFILINSNIRKRVVRTLQTLKSKRKLLSLALINRVVVFIGVILWFIAVSLGPISLVSAVSAIGPFYVFSIMIALSVFKPKILKEEISKSSISLKIFGIFLIFVGVWFVTF